MFWKTQKTRRLEQLEAENKHLREQALFLRASLARATKEYNDLTKTILVSWGIREEEKQPPPKPEGEPYSEERPLDLEAVNLDKLFEQALMMTDSYLNRYMTL